MKRSRTTWRRGGKRLNMDLTEALKEIRNGKQAIFEEIMAVK